MERTMDKHSFKKFAAILLAGCFCFLCFTSCKQKDDYLCGTYKQEELLLLFESQRSLFDDVAKLMIENDSFWEEGRRYEDDAHAWIMSPNDSSKMDLFSEVQQQILKDFFYLTRPYQISLNYKYSAEQTITITYTNEDRTDSYIIQYYCGDKTALNFYGRNAYKDWISYYKNSYHTFIDLNDDWSFYYDSKSLDHIKETEEQQ